jgi:hypothetical protein
MYARANALISTAATANLTVRHIMAFRALPPAFPAIRTTASFIGTAVLSNTPTEAVFDDNPRRNPLTAVHLSIRRATSRPR